MHKAKINLASERNQQEKALAYFVALVPRFYTCTILNADQSEALLMTA